MKIKQKSNSVYQVIYQDVEYEYLHLGIGIIPIYERPFNLQLDEEVRHELKIQIYGAEVMKKRLTPVIQDKLV